MAVNGHILMFGENYAGDGWSVLYSADDGATWSDASASINAVATFDIDTSAWWTQAVASDGNTWVVVEYGGQWAASHDSATWFGNTGASSNNNVINPDTPTTYEGVNGMLFMPPNGSPSGTLWKRWFAYGHSDPDGFIGPLGNEFLGRRPVFSQLCLAPAGTVSGSSVWQRNINPPPGKDGRPMSVFSAAYNPNSFGELFVLVYAYDTRTFELWRAAASEFNSADGSFTFSDVTNRLPLELSTYPVSTKDPYINAYLTFEQTAPFFCTYRLIVTDYDKIHVYEYSWVWYAFLKTSSIEFFNFYWPYANTFAYPYSGQMYPQYSGTPEPLGTFGSNGLVWVVRDIHTVPTPVLVSDVDSFVPGDVNCGMRTFNGTYLHSFYNYNVDGYIDIARGATPRAGYDAPISSAALDTVGYVYLMYQAPPTPPSLTTGATVDFCPVIQAEFMPPLFAGQVEIIEEGSSLLGATLFVDVVGSHWHPMQETVAFDDWAWRHGALPPELLAETLTLSTAVVTAVDLLVADIARFSGAATGHGTLIANAADVLTLIDRLVKEMTADASDSLVLSGVALSVHRQLPVLVDAVSLTEGVLDRHQAVDLVADLITVECLLQFAPLELLNDQVALAETAANWSKAITTLVDALVVADTVLAEFRIVAVIDDNLVVTDTALGLLQALELVDDGIELYTTFRIGDEVYRGYVLNAANKAASEFTNFEFNSLAQYGQDTFMASPNGLYKLAGSDDAGTSIEATIRTGLLAIAEGKQAQVISAYVGYTSDNVIVLKAIVTSPTGEKVAHWYRLAEQTATDTREGRIKLGLGLRSVYWQFEIVNVAGGSLNLDNVKLHRIALDRRI